MTSTFPTSRFVALAASLNLAALAADSVAPAAAPNPAGPTEEPVVVLEQFDVKEKPAETGAVSAERSTGESQQEVVKDAALARNGAQDATDALKNVSGVTVIRGSDGSNAVSVRGLAPSLTRVTVDGQRQSSGVRSGGALDSLPPEILRSIEVTKSLTPDMDGDAIGGTINLSTSNAADLKAPFAKLKEQLVYNSFYPHVGTRTSASAGTPFRLWSERADSGLIVTLGYDDTYRAFQFLESSGNWPLITSPGPAPWTGEDVPAFTRVNVQEGREHRTRTSVLLSADTRVGLSIFTLRFNHTRDTADREQSQVLYDVGRGTPTALTPSQATFSGVPLFLQGSDRNDRRSLTTLTLGSKFDRERIHFTASAGVARSTDDTLPSPYSNFVSNGTFTVSYDARSTPEEPAVRITNSGAGDSPTAYLDARGYSFNQLFILDNRATDKNASVQADLKLDLTSDPQGSHLKFGVKGSRLDRDIDQRRDVFSRVKTAPALSADGLVRTAARRLHDADYLIGPVTDPNAVTAILRNQPSQFVVDATETGLSSFGSDYTVGENIGAAYGLVRIVGRNWSVLTGARVEATSFRTSTFRPLFDGTGAPVGFVAEGTRRSYVDVLPGIHLRYTPQTNVILRASLNRTLKRPEYGDLAPYYLGINYPVRTGVFGNPALKPYEATNLDFSADYYRDGWGLLSASVFAKWIDDFHVDAQHIAEFADLGTFTLNRKINGSTATIGGVELAWRSDAFEIPGFVKKVSLGINYTLMHGRSEIPDRPGETFPLPSQARNQASLSLRAEQGRFSLDVSANYRSRTLEIVVAKDRDRFQDGTFSVDAGAGCKLGKSTQFSAGLRNLTAAPLVSYAGDRTRLRFVQFNAFDAYVSLDHKL